MKKKIDHALIICNGEAPSRKLLLPLLRSKPFILCADGGANKARSYGITPDCIIGDLDSITPRTRHFFSSVPVIHIADQNSTDLEKGLEFLLSERCRSAQIVGAMGERPDHTMANFSILMKYHRRLSLQFLDELCTVEIIRKKIRFSATIGQQISLVPMNKCIGIVTTGLKYPLRGETLQPGVREGSSNEAVKESVTISLTHGSLLLFRIQPTGSASL